MMKKIEDILYSKYLETRISHTIDFSNIKKVYETKYFWMKDHLKDVLPNNKNAEILVLGCGIGHEVYALNKMGYKNVLGMDISEEQIEIAKANGLNCIKANAFEFLEKNKEKLDVIIAFNFIEHFTLEEAFKFCALCYDSLRKEGILILLTPNGSCPLATHCRYSDPTHKIMFTSISITQLLSTVGFSKIDVRNVKPFGKYDYRIIMRILKHFGTAIIHLSWTITRILYLINGIKPPKVVSPDLLVIAYRGDKNHDESKS